ncbi:hypothetical protein [Devosia sp. SL43]|uniref:hypothetical protein n=1 Tax=Devosia sp. SL43 TaxID=2806348 RepID=UPI001F3F785A|nr:hypothetical protein [Devosia sp. SL43]UJW84649.1 hypothetical protein IM737_14615 [Devosia sp. SL43]
MSPHTTQPSFGPGPQDQLAPQAAPDPSPGHTTLALAERHEALWLSLSALHKDIVALGAKKPGAPVSEPVRIAAEGLLSDCAAFTRKRNERLPVAAADLGGLAVQLGQALAGLETWESHHTSWDARFDCRIWSLHRGYRPILRLNPPAAALKFQPSNMDELRNKLAIRISQRNRGIYREGFAAGLAAARAGGAEDGGAPILGLHRS